MTLGAFQSRWWNLNGLCLLVNVGLICRYLKIANFTDVPPKDEDALKVAVAQQPVAVAIEADKSVFQLYVLCAVSPQQTVATLLLTWQKW